ncbi:MAG: PAS domain S-box protein [Syntrophales bacterium]
MVKKQTLSQQEAGLRKHAEEIVRNKIGPMPKNLDTLTPEETSRLLHELQVHQIELEMQNEELRQTQVELNAAQARYFDLYDLAPVGYCTLSEKGLIIEANLTATTLLGVPRGALIKQPISRFILKADQDSYYLHHKQLFQTGEPQACELRMVKMDGIVFWAHLESTAAQDADGTPVFRIVMSDNPERKRMEEALKESEFNIRNMAEQLVDVLFATDDSGFITFVSPSALQMFGWKPEEMAGRSFIEYLSLTEIPGAVAQFKDALVSGKKIKNQSFVMKRKDESAFQGELSSSVIWKEGRTAGTVGIIRDITERTRAEEELKESEERYRNQVEAIIDVAYSINSGGDFTYISPVVRNLLGYGPDEIIGRHFLEFVHHADHEPLKRKFSELREGVVSHDEYRVIGKSGDVKWVRSQTSPILDIMGFEGGRGIIIDISEHKRAEEALHRVKENFRRSLDESPLGVRIVTIEGETIYANRAILDIYSYRSIEELQATPVKKRYTPESYAEFLLRAEKRRQGIDVPSEYTIDILRNNGDVRHLQVFRKDILWDDERQYQVIYQDVTERKRAEEALRESQEQLRDTHRLAHIGIWNWIADTDTVIWTEELYRIAGLDPMIPAPTYAEHPNIYSPESWDRLKAAVEKATETGEHYQLELELIRPDGATRCVNAFGGATYDNHGRITGLHGTVQDITDRKLMEDALVAESQRLEETNTALRVILQRKEEDQKEIERKIATNIRKLVLPNIEKLRGLKLNDLQANCLETVSYNLQQVTSPFLQNLAACFADFTPREIQVANMIRQGKTSKEIAAIFNSSIRSVDFHRDNIRKKLDLSNQKSNLRTFLMKLSE